MREFPCGPVIRTLSFTAEGVGSIPGGGTKIQANHMGQLEKKKKREGRKERKKGSIDSRVHTAKKERENILGVNKCVCILRSV